MKQEDFHEKDETASRIWGNSYWQDHKSLPITVLTIRHPLDSVWYFANKVERAKEMNELKGRSIEDVTEEEINLLLLKYCAI